MGTIDPNRLRFAQPEVSRDFANAAHGTVYDLGTSLANGTVLPTAIPRIEIGEFAGHIWSFDTRRLLAFQLARQQDPSIEVRYVKLDAQGVMAKIANFDPAGSAMGTQVGVRQGGIHATRLYHFNPELPRMNPAGPAADMSAEEHQSGLRVLGMLTAPGQQAVWYPNAPP